MRYLMILLGVVLMFGCGSMQGERQSGEVLRYSEDFQEEVAGLKDNLLVQNAIENHEAGVMRVDQAYEGEVAAAKGEGDSEKKVEVLTVERERKLEGLKGDCVAALERAKGVSVEMGHKEEAGRIDTLVKRIKGTSDNKRFRRE